MAHSSLDIKPLAVAAGEGVLDPCHFSDTITSPPNTPTPVRTITTHFQPNQMMPLGGPSRTICCGSPKQAARLGRSVAPLLYQAHTVGLGYPAAIRVADITRQSVASHQPSHATGTRNFSTTSANLLRDVFPAKETAYIRKTPPAWAHPGYTEEEMLAVTPAHRPPKTVGDWVAWKLVRFAR